MVNLVVDQSLEKSFMQLQLKKQMRIERQPPEFIGLAADPEVDL
jgi:hypothetical protein